MSAEVALPKEMYKYLFRKLHTSKRDPRGPREITGHCLQAKTITRNLLEPLGSTDQRRFLRVLIDD